MNFQHTIADRISCSGVGLHTGSQVRLSIQPAETNTGIVFRRSDIPGCEPVRSVTENVMSTSFATTIGNGSMFVATVEHLMSAFHGLGVDNALVELDGEEVPIMDGSAASFVYLIRMAGLKRQTELRSFIQITKPIVVAESDKKAGLYPDDHFRVTYTIDYTHPMIKLQSYDYQHDPRLYESQIASARTFGFLAELNDMQSNGFASGGSLDNAVLVGDASVINESGLRYSDEFVRHKVLDAMGDMYMAGKPIIGHYLANKSGHGLNHDLMRKLASSPDCFEVVQLPQPMPLAADQSMARAE
ncbi:MAG: UDP-3-O-acyl-N-acetylglucosamine deacetylase [Candidatus Alcyoniella australis]|nr:UDP-3-O-acyl-N-acetylglucosamine deacetylase [Candidatus Alcyoniella australis]